MPITMEKETTNQQNITNTTSTNNTEQPSSTVPSAAATQQKTPTALNRPQLSFEDTGIYSWYNTNVISEYFSIDKSLLIDDIEKDFNKPKCQSLEDLLRESTFDDNDKFWPFVSSFDFFNTGLLNGSGTSVPLTTSLAKVSQKITSEAEYFFHNLKSLNIEGGECMWTYRYKFNPHFFPSFSVEAHPNDEDCEGKVQFYKRYFKVPSKTFPHEDCWFIWQFRTIIAL